MQMELDIGYPLLSKKSPLMYPGGKTRAWKIFEPHLPKGVTKMVSPFIGGGSIELNCAARGIKVNASDNFEPLVNFWQHFISNSNEVIDTVLSIFPLDFEQKKYYFNSGLKPNQRNHHGIVYDDLERASLFLCLNKQSFRGWTLAQGPTKNYSKGSANVTLFEKFKDWYNPNIVVNCKDYRDVLDQDKDTFMYFDPPYVDKEFFYGWKKNNADKDSIFDHYEFKDRISKLKNRWILSYLKHDLIMDLYKEYKIVEYQQNYTIKIKKNTEPNVELFIMNF